MEKYVLEFSKRSPYNHTQIMPVDQWNIRLNFPAYFDAGIIHRDAFGPYKQRTQMLGLSGTAFQSSFTVACSFSHRRAWQKFLESGNGMALITEDDAVKIDDLDEADVVKKLGEHRKDWHFLQLGRCWDFCETDRTIFEYAAYNVVQSESPLCSHAYIVTRYGAQVLLNHSLPHITSVDLLFTLLTRMRLLNLYSLTPPLYLQKRSEDSHDSTELVECDTSGNRNDIPNKDAHTISLIERSTVKYFINTYEIPVYHTVNGANCEQIIGTQSLDSHFLINMKRLHLSNVILWNNNDIMNHDTLRRDIRNIARNSGFPVRVCESNDHIMPNSIVISLANHFTRIPNFLTSNRYIFYGTAPFAFRKHPEHFIQWFVNNDSFNAIDSLDFVSERKYVSEWVMDSNGRSATSNKVVIVEDVTDEKFCNFLDTQSFSVVKLGFRHPKCKRPYTHVKKVTRSVKLSHMKKSRIGVILSKKYSIPSDFYTFAGMGKIVCTDNPIIHKLYAYMDVKHIAECNVNKKVHGDLKVAMRSNRFKNRFLNMLPLFL